MSTETAKWDRLPAGRDLDLCVALALGWHGPVLWIDDEWGRDPYLFEPTADPAHVAANDRDHDCIVPRWSTDIDAALDLLNIARARGLDVAASSQARARAGAPPAKAIVRAVLAALESQA